MKNTFVKVLSLLMALMMAVGAFSMVTVTAAECDHANATKEVVDPSCGSIGYTKNVCPDCGEEWISDPKEALKDHTWTEVGPTQATCTAPGYDKHKVCAVCGETDPADLSTIIIEPQKPHAFHITVVVPATCTTKGYTTKQCARCGFVDHKNEFDQVTDVVNPAHKYVYEVIDYPNASACVTGTIRVTCSVCGDTYDIVEENKHNWQKIEGTIDRSENSIYKNVPVVGTTCEYKYKSGYYCTICGAVDNTRLEVNDVNTHALESVRDEANKAEKWFLGNTIPSAKVNATLLNMEWNGVKFAVGTSVYLAADCDAKGYEIKYCTTCKDYVLVEEAKLACLVDGDKDATPFVEGWKDASGTERFGKDATAADINKTAYRCETLTRVTKCALCKETVKTDVKQAESHDYAWENKEAGTKGTTVIAKTCLTNGKTVYDCKYCTKGDYETVETTDVALGKHSYPAAPTFKTGFDCTKDCEDAYVYTCTFANCKNEDGKKTITEDYTAKEGVAHDYKINTATPVPATCVAPGYYTKTCKNCTVTVDVALTEANPNLPAVAKQHKVYVTLTGATKLDSVSAQTCTEAAVELYLCACGEKVEVSVGEAKGHNTSDTYVDINGNGKCDKNEKGLNVAQVATCSKKAASVGYYCTDCDTDTFAFVKDDKKSVVGDLNPNNHDGESAKVPLTPVAATCKDKGYTPIYYPCCGDIFEVYADNAAIDATRHANITVYAAVAATCTTNGKIAYTYCNDCQKNFEGGSLNETKTVLVGGTEKTAAQLVTDKLNGNDKGHLFVDPAAGEVYPETCDKPGVRAHKVCSKCGAVEINGVVTEKAFDKDGNEIAVKAAKEIKPHGTEHMGFHKGKAPTCDEDGYAYPDSYCCAQCDKITVAKIDEALKDDSLTEIDKKDLNDLKASLTKLGHKNKNGVDFNGVYNVTWSGIIDCTKDCYTEYNCPDCGAKWLDNFQKATHTAHKYKDDKGNWIDTTPIVKWDTDVVANQKACLSGKTEMHECAYCKQTEAGKRTEVVSHTAYLNGVDVQISFACNEYKDFLGLTCKHCGVTVSKDVADEHHNPVDSILLPTCTSDGHYIHYCANGCGFYNPAKLADGSANPDYIPNEYYAKTNHKNKVEIARVPATATTPGSVTYSCPDCAQSWTEVIEVSESATYTVSADKIAAGEIITVTYAVSGKVTEFSAKNVTLTYDATRLTFVGVEAADLNGLYAVASVNGNALGVSLVVANDLNGNAQKVTTTVEGTVLFTLTFVANKTASGTANIADKNVTITAVGNLNGDTKVTAEDAQAIFAKVGTNEVASDVNLDGIVNLADVIALAKFAASAQTGADYLEMVGELDKLEAEVFALLEAGKLNDVNDDKIVNISDAYALIERVTDELGNTYTELGNKVTMKAVVAYLNVNAELVTVVA